jgi:hypothetical protein
MIGGVDPRNAGADDQDIEVLDSHVWLPCTATAESMKAGAHADKQMSVGIEAVHCGRQATPLPMGWSWRGCGRGKLWSPSRQIA